MGPHHPVSCDAVPVDQLLTDEAQDSRLDDGCLGGQARAPGLVLRISVAAQRAGDSEDPSTEPSGPGSRARRGGGVCQRDFSFFLDCGSGIFSWRE